MISVDLKSPKEANAFYYNPILEKIFFHMYETSILTFNITRMGVVKEVPADWTTVEVTENIIVGKSLKCVE